MVHVGEQKTPVTKRIYAPYDKRTSIINAGTKNASTEIPLCILRSSLLVAVVLLPFILFFSHDLFSYLP